MDSSPALVRFAMTRSGFRISMSWSPEMSPAVTGARALLVQAHFGHVARVHADRHRLQIQQNVDHVLLDAFDGGVFVQHAFDLDLRDRRTRQEDSSTRRRALPSV
jgi:hypothetical protein